MPEVSVIIPVYNVEQWLPACLDSVLAQTLQDIEVICVNDCSPDNCAAILEGYASLDRRIHVITHEKNGGQGIARNTGFAACTGRYVYFLDSDDMVAPEALEELLACAEENRLDGIFFDSQVVFDSPELAKRYISYPAKHTGTYPGCVLSGLELFESFMAQRDWTCYLQRQFWSADFLRTNGIISPSLPSHEDEGFAFEAILRAHRVMFLPKPYFIRRYREGSVMTSKMGLRDFASYFQVFCHMAKVIDELGLKTVATDRNAIRIYCTCERLYNQLVKDGIDVSSVFRGTDIEDQFRFFALANKSYLHYGLLSPEVQAAVDRAEEIYIYGAGVIAQNVFRSLVRQGRAIEGFLVTDAAKNPSAYQGLHVLGLDSIPVDRDALVVIAATDGYRAEIERSLDAAGWQHVYYKGGICSGT